jgi:flagellar hook-associated protein 3 FlgL
MANITNGTLAFYTRSTTQMSAIRRDAETLQSRLSTGSRLNRSSEDPVAASHLRSLERVDKLAAIDAANAARAKDELSLAGGALASVAQDIARARELALWAANETISDRERASIGQEVEQLRLSIFASVNGRDTSGRPLFAGEAGGDAYQWDAAGNAVYAGTPVSGDIALGEGQHVTRGVTGPEFLNFNAGGSATDLLAFLKTLSDGLQGGAADPVAMSSAAVEGLDDALEALTRTQTVVGTRLAWIETVQDRQVVKSQSRAGEKSEIGGVDLATTIAELQQMLTVLEASQAGFSRLSSLSLFDSIR